MEIIVDILIQLKRSLRARLAMVAVLVAVALTMSGVAVVADSSPAGAVVGGTAVDIDYASSAGSEGVYITHSDGTIEARDGLSHFGDKPALGAGETVIALSVRPAVDGYWLFTNLGRVIAYGAAVHFGDASALALAAPMISAIATPDGLGYYMVAEDGGIFTFGTAVFYGSIPQILPGVTLDAQVIGIVPSPTGLGYLLVAADGGIFTFGDALFYGSVPGVLPGVSLDSQIVAVIAQPAGYLMVAGDGGIFTFGTAAFFGSLGGTGASGIVGVAVKPDNSGYVMVDTQANLSPFGNTTGLGTIETDPAADLLLIENFWQDLSDSWLSGRANAIAFYEANNYPDMGSLVCLDFRPAGYSEEFILHVDTVEPDPNWTILGGPRIGHNPDGTIYIMTMTIIRSEHGIARFEFVKEVHATILNGEVRFFFSC